MSRYIAGTKDRMSDLDFYHPVGELYITLSSTNPGTRWGGTWELMSEAQFPMSAGSNYLAGDTGGYADQINVAHTHGLKFYRSGGVSNNGWWGQYVPAYDAA